MGVSASFGIRELPGKIRGAFGNRYTGPQSVPEGTLALGSVSVALGQDCMITSNRSWPARDCPAVSRFWEARLVGLLILAAHEERTGRRCWQEPRTLSLRAEGCSVPPLVHPLLSWAVPEG